MLRPTGGPGLRAALALAALASGGCSLIDAFGAADDGGSNPDASMSAELCLNDADDDGDGDIDCGDSDCFATADCETGLGDEVCDATDDDTTGGFPDGSVDELACRCAGDAGCGQVGSPLEPWLCHGEVSLPAGASGVCGPPCVALDWCAGVGKVCDPSTGRCVPGEELGPCLPGDGPCWGEPVVLSTAPFVPRGVDVGDFDGDGFQDLAVRTDESVELVFGGSDPSRREIVQVDESPALMVTFVRTGAGARERLAVLFGEPGSRPGKFVIYGGVGDAPREPETIDEIDLTIEPRAIAAIELAPVDAFTDFFVVENSLVERVVLLRGPDYAPSSTSLALLNLDRDRVAVGDFSGDGIEDVTAVTGGQLRLLRGTSDGGLEQSGAVSVGPAALPQPFGVRLAVASPCDDCAGEAFLRFFDAAGNARGAVVGLDDPFSPSAIAVGRLDGDALPDLVLGNSATGSEQFVFALRGTGEAAEAGRAVLPAPGPVTCLAVANLDRSGPPEIVGCAPGEQALLVYPGQAP